MLDRSPLLPDDDIWLIHDECADGFIDIFRECWQRVPASDRGRIIAYWRSSGVPAWPKIELSTMWCDSKSSYGQTTTNGMEVLFDAASFRHFPKGVVRWIIAHELAHVFQKVEGKRPGGDDEDQNEGDADNIAERWGFDKTARTILQMRLEDGDSFEKACKMVKKLFKE